MSTKRSAPISPASVKKVKVDDDPKTPRDGSKELTKGAKWMVAQVEKMQEYHTACLKVVTVIIQYRTYARQMRMKNPQIPPGLMQQLQSYWESYEAIKRHVEWYMTQNALHASTPSRPPPITSSPIAPIVPPLSAIQTEVPKSSPIPLSTASMLAYDNQSIEAPSVAPPNLPTVPAVPSVPAPKPIPAFAQDLGGMSGTSTTDQLDLSSLGMEELSALLNDNNANPFGDGSSSDFLAGMFDDSNSAETDKLLASLSQPAGDGQATQADAQTFDFDFGTEQADMAELAGLFGTETKQDAEVKETAPVAPVADVQQTGGPKGHVKRPSIGVGSTPNIPPETPQIPSVEVPAPTAETKPDPPSAQVQEASENPEPTFGEEQDYDLSNIDLEDFNFGDGSMPNVEGDEFESLFAEFK
ncbi:hypothetical protein BD324DRAFT_678509 [Kockovaella imperatae]|uniref:Uncharacterized protein n=1 Tax=Kockovaella imperatae TaxID=4999 RepID=A0A1Y1USY6_9TREE|nr:hypothetical protein BD324DRAFT_678509 [Kockovaella imperatae]ORX41121.1 hypothetical protein BD324DRAFT_678509 [Kockovaella imperatae]